MPKDRAGDMSWIGGIVTSSDTNGQATIPAPPLNDLDRVSFMEGLTQQASR